MSNDGWHGSLRRSSARARVATRVVDPRRRPLPDFVVLGAQRSGTTTLFRHLAEHPQVRPPVRKEIQFLSLHWSRGLPWYRRHFPALRDPYLRTGEASPYYLFHPDAPARAAAALPSTRFVALLRNPSDRALSHFNHNRANGLENLGFEAALVAEPGRLARDPFGRNHRLFSYVSRGLYAEQVRRWQHAVGDRLLVVLSEDLFQRPSEVLAEVQLFLGLDRWEPAEYAVPVRRLRPPDRSMTPAVARRLQERFASPNRELAVLLRRDLSAWADGVPSPGADRLPPTGSEHRHGLGARQP